MPYPLHRKITGFNLLLLALGWPLGAQADSQLAVDMGCYSCHGANLRDEAPSIEHLAERLSPASAKALVQWLAEGAK